MSRTLYHGDNLEAMRRLKSKTVTLAYFDPPFNSNKTYAKGKGEFHDTFVKPSRSLQAALRKKNLVLADLVSLSVKIHGESMAAYLQYMALRLLEVKRLLKDDGSFYYHCDDNASHYVKTMLDCVFGANHYRNDLIWRRAIAHNDAKRFGRIVDNILYYVCLLYTSPSPRD